MSLDIGPASRCDLCCARGVPVFRVGNHTRCAACQLRGKRTPLPSGPETGSAVGPPPTRKPSDPVGHLITSPVPKAPTLREAFEEAIDCMRRAAVTAKERFADVPQVIQAADRINAMADLLEAEKRGLDAQASTFTPYSPTGCRWCLRDTAKPFQCGQCGRTSLLPTTKEP